MRTNIVGGWTTTLGLLLLPLLACRHEGAGPAAQAKPSLTPVKVERIEMRQVAAETAYSANIVPESQVNLAFRSGGYVDRLLEVQGREVQEGDLVAKGSVLATLRQMDFTNKADQARAQSAQARASLSIATSQQAEAKASLDGAQADFQRAKNLFASQSLTKADYDAAQTRALAAQAKYDAAQGQIQAAQAQINGAAQVMRDAELALQDSSLKAPGSGVILKKSIESGSLVAPGAPVFVIANIRTVKAVFGIPDTEVSSLKQGQLLTVESEAVPGATFRGRISNISPSADIKSRVFDVDVSIPNPNGQLKAGMIASVKIGGAAGRAQQQVLILPLSSVVRSRKNPDRYAVFVAEGDGGVVTAKLREVEIGRIVNSGVAVLGGIEAGARVITSGSSIVSEGQQVQIVP